MLYKNISDQPVWILQSSIKTLIEPGAIINLNISDINHSGSSMRFFESLDKHNIVKANGWDKTDQAKYNAIAKKLKNDPILQKINDSDMPEITIEKNLL